MSGKLRGNLYKVFLSPDGSKYYSLTKAKESGFCDAGYEDGRKKKKPSTKKGKVRAKSDSDD